MSDRLIDQGEPQSHADADGDFGWNPFDFLLSGEFCPPAAIPPMVEKMREEVDAEAVLLLVAGSRGLLGTLCFCVSEDASGSILEDFLRSGPRRVRRKLRKHRNAVRLPGDGSDWMSEDPRWRAKNVLERIVWVAAEENRRDVIEAVGAVEDWVAVQRPPAMRRMQMTVAAFARNPRTELVRQRDDAALLEADETMLELAVMASATANTSVYRDTMTTTRVDEKLDPEELESAGGDLSVGTQLLVELAAEVTDSTAAAYYLLDPVRGVLNRVATHPKPGCGEVDFPLEMPADSACAGAAAVRRRRPVAHGWDGARDQLEPTLPLDGDRPPYTEIATPVPGPLASSSVSCAGVLTVLRLAPSMEQLTPYAAYDYALLRNVALRLALLHATEDMEAASELFRDLTIRQPQSGSPPEAREEDRSPRPEHPVPDDVAAVLPSISTALSKIARLTGSHSATFRLALPNVDTPALHGLALVRIAAHSEDGMLAPRVVQDLMGAGVNCLAARTGIAQNVPFVDRHRSYEEVREGTKSEISVPVRVEGMVVGTVNLESPVARAYDARVSTAIAFAEHVGTVLADARLAKARQLHQYATQIVARAHDLSAETKKIVEATSASPPEVQAKVDVALRSINERARGIRKFDPRDGRRAASSLPELVEAAWKKAEIDEVDSEIEAGGGHWRNLDEQTAGVVYDCLRHVFVNVQKHMPIEAEELAEVRVFQGVVLGGRRYDVLRVRNESKEPIDLARAVNLYRVPIVDREKSSRRRAEENVDLPRFGAYLAGNQARAIGGNVHLAVESPERVRLTVMVPQPLEGGADA